MAHGFPERSVPFYGDDLVAVHGATGTVWLPLIRLCENLGLDRQAQTLVDSELPTSVEAEIVELEQIAMRQRMDAAARAFLGMREEMRDVQVCLQLLEESFAQEACINERQAAEVSLKIKALAELLSTRNPDKNHYQSVFQEVYRR